MDKGEPDGVTLRIPSYDRAAAAELLKERPDAPLSAYKIGSKAHRRWDLKQYEEAALLFCVAAERARTEEKEPNQSPNYAVRAAITLSLAGRSAEVEPVLRDATAFDWVAAGLPHDTHMIEWAFTSLLLNIAQNARTGFSELFAQAVARCQEVGIAYPRIHPEQESLLSAAITLEEWDVVARIVQLMAARRPLSRPARAQLAQARQALQDAGR